MAVQQRNPSLGQTRNHSGGANDTHEQRGQWSTPNSSIPKQTEFDLWNHRWNRNPTSNPARPQNPKVLELGVGPETFVFHYPCNSDDL